MRRRLLLVVAAAVPFAAAAVVHGCSNEPPFESVCRWLTDPDNCYRQFHADSLATADAGSQLNPYGDCITYDPSGPAAMLPTEASAAAPGVSNGFFANRAMLDTCIINTGGQVTIDPPLDLTMWPPDPNSDAGPTTYTIKFVRPDGDTCGQATYTSQYSFSITINGPPDAGAAPAGDAGTDLDASSSADAAPTYPYGTYAQVNPPERAAFDVTCPSGETHHFNLDEVLPEPGADAGLCPAFASFLPYASFQVYPGDIDNAGALSFAIVYPPTSSYPAADASTPTADPPTVYFNCSIPAAPELCADQVKDGAETDIDCGGPQLPSQSHCGSCPPRCMAMQQCICDADCDPSMHCAANGMGMNVCTMGTTTSGLNKCPWTATNPTCTGSSSGTGGDSGAGGSAGTGGSAADAGDGG